MLTTLVSCLRTPLLRTLTTIFGEYKSQMMAYDLVRTLIGAPCETLQHLTLFTTSVMPSVNEGKETILLLSYVSSLSTSIVCRAVQASQVDADDSTSGDRLNAIVVQGHEILVCVEKALKETLSKNTSSVTIEVCDLIVKTLHRFYETIGLFDPGLTARMQADYELEMPVVADARDEVAIMLFELRLRILQQCVAEGRMEVRNHGIVVLSDELLRIYRDLIQPNPAGPNHPLVEHISQYIHQYKLLETIVSVDSHPALISSSPAIVGFLVASSTYENADTDLIWGRVVASEDPRVTLALLGLLHQVFSVSPTLDGADYICSKILKLSLDRFDAKTFDFASSLLKNILDRMESNYAIQAPRTCWSAVRLCVRILRECTSSDKLTFEQKGEYRRSFEVHLARFRDFGLFRQELLAEIFQVAVDDLEGNSPFAPGSLAIVELLTSTLETGQLQTLVDEFDFVQILVNDLCNQSVSSARSEVLQSHVQTRLSLLTHVVDMVPGSLTSILSDALFQDVFAGDVMPVEGRAMAWSLLSHFAKVPRRNLLVDRMFDVYLGQLRLQDIILPVLEFVKTVIVSRTAVDPSSDLDEKAIIKFPAHELLETMIYKCQNPHVSDGAVTLMIKLYLDHESIRSAPKSAVEATHIALIDSCLSRLHTAAEGLRSQSSRDSMQSVEEENDSGTSDSSPVDNKLLFKRTLQFMRIFLSSMRSCPRFNKTVIHSATDTSQVDETYQGEPVILHVQAFGESASPNIQKVVVGSLDTAAALERKLASLTGLSKFSVIFCGQRYSLADQSSALIKDLELDKGLLILREEQSEEKQASVKHIEAEVLKHFDELYDLLGLEDPYAEDIYNFLMLFTIQPKISTLVRSSDKSIDEIFPAAESYKLMYSAHALVHELREEDFANQPDSAFLRHSLSICVTTLIRDADNASEGGSKQYFAILNLIDCVNFALGAGKTFLSGNLFESPVEWVRRLLAFISVPTETQSITDAFAVRVVYAAFTSLVESSRLDPAVLEVLKSTDFAGPLQKILLESKALDLRRAVAERIFTISGWPPVAKSTFKRDKNGQYGPSTTVIDQDIVRFLWDAVLKIIPAASQQYKTSTETFEVAQSLLEYMVNHLAGELDFGLLVGQLGSLVLDYELHEFVGREASDPVVFGLMNLLQTSMEKARNEKIEIETGDLAEELLGTLLFPDFSRSTPGLPIMSPVPVLDSACREQIYKVILLASEDDFDMDMKILEICNGLVPPDFAYEPDWSFDRYKLIRSAVGYAGLRNLSNTCYLNSLTTQLFMNLDFRRFILRATVTDSRAQSLLVEMKKIFAEMQESWRKDVDPTDFVESIQTYDATNIDVNIQMDVEEFYNLLFDRLESQVQPEQKDALRSLYGGQLVQQIKSKECPHVSEQIQPFSAIQCEIQGKLNLEESLRAFVEGEVLQGANKYHCSKCGDKVDAVKRVCLKDMPNNLIFHLKRFDFDINTLSRSKINDEFRFPLHIDMAPFTVDHLTDPTKPIERDVFELSGVLIHSGTAEAGHYYSYIKQRPLESGPVGAWVEFNDSDVTYFDVGRLADQCYGGFSEPELDHRQRYCKAWNAYMLFYKRVKAPAKEVPMDSGNALIPNTVPLPRNLASLIAKRNELFLRGFCLMDPNHASFIRAMLVRLREREAAGRQGLDRMEELVVSVVLGHLEQVSSRSKDHKDVDEVVQTLLDIAETTPRFSLAILEWFSDHTDAVRNLMLRSPYQLVRSSSGRLLVTVLQNFRQASDPEKPDATYWHERYWACFAEILENLRNCGNRLHLFRAAWDDYYSLMSGLARLGKPELVAILDHDYLIRCLELSIIHQEDIPKIRTKYRDYCRLVDKGRKFSHRKLQEFMSVLLEQIDLDVEAVPETMQRGGVDEDMPIPASETELYLLSVTDRKGTWILLKRLIESEENPVALKALLTWALQEVVRPDNLVKIMKTIHDGLRLSPATNSIPYLEATVLFAEACARAEVVDDLISFAMKGCACLENAAGMEHYKFIERLVTAQNPHFPEGWFIECVVRYASEWAPGLLTYEHVAVRGEAFEILQAVIFLRLRSEEAEEVQVLLRKSGRDLVETVLKNLKERIFEATHQGPVLDAKLIEEVCRVVEVGTELLYDENDEEDVEFIANAIGEFEPWAYPSWFCEYLFTNDSCRDEESSC